MAKSVDCWTYVGTSGYSVKFQIPNQSQTFNYTGDMQSTTLTIDQSSLKFFEHNARFQWTATVSGETVGNEFWEIAPSTGSMATKFKNSPTQFMNTPSTYQDASKKKRVSAGRCPTASTTPAPARSATSPITTSPTSISRPTSRAG